MSLEIYTYSPMKGVHGKDPTMYVVLSLEKALDSGASTSEVKALLKRLGTEASQGFPGLDDNLNAVMELQKD